MDSSPSGDVCPIVVRWPLIVSCRDSIDHASRYGVQFVAQPGGSIADDEVVGACCEYGMTMAFTGLRLFHH